MKKGYYNDYTKTIKRIKKELETTYNIFVGIRTTEYLVGKEIELDIRKKHLGEVNINEEYLIYPNGAGYIKLKPMKDIKEVEEKIMGEIIPVILQENIDGLKKMLKALEKHNKQIKRK